MLNGAKLRELYYRVIEEAERPLPKADMMYLVYGIHKLKTKPGAVWLKNKLERSWKKIMPEGRKLIKDDYKIAFKVLNIAIKK